MPVDEAVHAIVTGDHAEGGVNDPAFDLAVIDLLQAGQLEAVRATDGALCLQLTDEGQNALTVLSFIGDPDAD
jgi:hypothetical protein